MSKFEAMREALENAAYILERHDYWDSAKPLRALLAAAQQPDTTSHDSMQLAQMVMSDCGVSCAATDRLQTRVAERIQRHIDGLQPEQLTLTDCMVIRGAEQIHDALRAVGCYYDFDVDLLGTDTAQYIAESVFKAMLDAQNES